jgi:hypothetical protein
MNFNLEVEVPSMSWESSPFMRAHLLSFACQVVMVSHVTCHFLESGTIARVTIQVDPAMTVK